jgi:hypothetical protein
MQRCLILSRLSQRHPFLKMNRDSSIVKVIGYDLENSNCIPDGSRDCRVQVETSQTPTPTILGLDLERQAHIRFHRNRFV